MDKTCWNWKNEHHHWILHTCIYLVNPTLASRTTKQMFLPKFQKLWKCYVFTDYIQKRDQKSENFEWIRKTCEWRKQAIPIRFKHIEVNVIIISYSDIVYHTKSPLALLSSISFKKMSLAYFTRGYQIKRYTFL